MEVLKVSNKIHLTTFMVWLLVSLIAISFILALIAYLIDVRADRNAPAYLGYGGLLAPETNQISISVDEFSKSTFLANASLSIGKNDTLPIASVSDEIILLMYDITSEMLTPYAYSLMQRSKSSDAAFFETPKKIKIPASGNPFIFPFDSYLIAVRPMYMMNKIGYNLPDKAQMGIRLAKHLKVVAHKKYKIDRPWFQPVNSNRIDCNSGCGIKDNIFIFQISHAWWYRWALIGFLICLLIPLFVVLKSSELSAAYELLTLILSIGAVRTLILGYQSGQVFAMDFYFGAYFASWLFIQLFRLRKLEMFEKRNKEGA